MGNGKLISPNAKFSYPYEWEISPEISNHVFCVIDLFHFIVSRTTKDSTDCSSKFQSALKFQSNLLIFRKNLIQLFMILDFFCFKVSDSANTLIWKFTSFMFPKLSLFSNVSNAWTWMCPWLRKIWSQPPEIYFTYLIQKITCRILVKIPKKLLSAISGE